MKKVSKKLKTVWSGISDDPFFKVLCRPDAPQYVFGQRKGKDSVAFILYDRKRYPRLGVIKEFRYPLNDFLTGAFGGSLDKPGLSLKEIVIEEVDEEAGYQVDLDRVHYIGKRFATNFMNQFVYLFVVDVTDLKAGPRKPQDKAEESAKVLWQGYNEINGGHCWKAQVIVSNLDQTNLLD